MTDLSSKEDNLTSAEMMMARDLMESKIKEAKASTKMTDLLMIGNFRMELVPTTERDNANTFKEILAFLHEKYGDELLRYNQMEHQGHMHG